uniref:Uncharacterized protein n=1 Tax=Anguilla anguilla TaxID=7936 RepID=A0A0E9STW5_ANGAN
MHPSAQKKRYQTSSSGFPSGACYSQYTKLH